MNCDTLLINLGIGIISGIISGLVASYIIALHFIRKEKKNDISYLMFIMSSYIDSMRLYMLNGQYSKIKDILVDHGELESTIFKLYNLKPKGDAWNAYKYAWSLILELKSIKLDSLTVTEKAELNESLMEASAFLDSQRDT